MKIFEEGNILEAAIGRPNGMLWDISGGYAQMVVHIDSESIDQFRLGGHYDFACVPIRDVMFFCVKYGQYGHTNWMSAPYSPHLSDSHELVIYESGTGMPLFICLVRTDDGVIIDTDSMVLGNSFSNAVAGLSAELRHQEFDMGTYQRTIQAVYQQIPTDEELASLAEIRYSID